ncbi:hypothetical protein [Novosphingobium sp. NBM11]|uniref:hypothetical protein n=1 Tax=Novosphingobium sp. NBM11 TaxID=2596914 RepID=UPI0018926665|nr:hypothetical protein [Novosphingobium sp. NBM11]
MLVTQEKKYFTPLLVDEDFLTALDDRLQEIASFFLDDLAKKNEISRASLDIALASQVSPSYDDPMRDVVREAMRINLVKYEVEWINGVKTDRINIHEMIKILKFEPSKPFVVNADVGYSSDYCIRFRIGGEYSPFVRLTIKSEHDRRNHLEAVFDNLMKQYQPQSFFLHHRFSHIILSIFVAVMMILCIIFLISILNNMYGKNKIDNLYIIIYPCSILLFIVVPWSSRLYRRIFPIIDFSFGRSRRDADVRNLIFTVFLTVFVPLIITIFIQPYMEKGVK